MNRITHMLIVAGVTAMSSPLLAQTMTPSQTTGQTPPTAGAVPPSDPSAVAPTTPAPTPPTASIGAADITDADIRQFAKAVVALEAIQKDATIPEAQKQTQMAAKVQAEGLEPAKFNAIAQTAQSDPSLQTKVQAAIQAEAGSAAPAPTN